jgi:parvulin-like peptidyl-prolyl isomerase
MAGESFAALAERYSQDDASRYRGGLLATYPTEGLGVYSWILDSLDIGEVSGPREIPLSPTETGYHIIQLVRVIPPHTADPVEDRALLEEFAADWKQQKMLTEWVAQLKEEIYWEVKYKF